jgi:hypothetical protein
MRNVTIVHRHTGEPLRVIETPPDPLTLNLPYLKGLAKVHQKRNRARGGKMKLYEALDLQARRVVYRNWPSLVQAHDRAKEASHV